MMSTAQIMWESAVLIGAWLMPTLALAFAASTIVDRATPDDQDVTHE